MTVKFWILFLLSIIHNSLFIILQKYDNSKFIIINLEIKLNNTSIYILLLTHLLIYNDFYNDE